jgi:hypothetical protein
MLWWDAGEDFDFPISVPFGRSPRVALPTLSDPGLSKLISRLGQDDDPHGPSRWSTRESTCSSGIPSVRPRCTARTRSEISASKACCTAASATAAKGQDLHLRLNRRSQHAMVRCSFAKPRLDPRRITSQVENRPNLHFIFLNRVDHTEGKYPAQQPMLILVNNLVDPSVKAKRLDVGP